MLSLLYCTQRCLFSDPWHVYTCVPVHATSVSQLPRTSWPHKQERHASSAAGAATTPQQRWIDARSLAVPKSQKVSTRRHSGLPPIPRIPHRHEPVLPPHLDDPDGEQSPTDDYASEACCSDALEVAGKTPDGRRGPSAEHSDTDEGQHDAREHNAVAG